MNNQTKTLLPAEWTKQDAILLCWPHKSMDWQPILNEVETAFDSISYYICESQTLIIIAHDEEHQAAIKQRLINKKARLSAVKWLLHTNNDSWCRDFGPITVLQDNKPLALDCEFNGWGNKFPAQFDNQTNQLLAEQQLLSCPLLKTSLVLEGGSIDSDGHGTILTTSQCLLDQQRNPQLNQQQIEQQLKELLGAKRIIWLQHGELEGDDTDSHVDNLARFCNPQTIAYAHCDDPDDSHYLPLQQLQAELQQLTGLDGQPYQLLPLTIPKALYYQQDRLPASYVNFLITNERVLMPTYNDPQDALNLEKLQSVFSDRKVTGIDCSAVIRQSGSIHCLTMQLPRHTVNN
ncbi:MAG: agmatine deiminase family protein [Gammaproteobacteria bacterium]|nr:agmatine deiminase family protein [Gammaproteobacteria bacterium]